MSKYTGIQSDIFSIFNTSAWKAENIRTIPADYEGEIGTNEFIRINILVSGRGANLVSSSGIVIVDIFTPAGFGPKRQNFIADKLDAYLQNKSVSTESKSVTQFRASTLNPIGIDSVNKSLSRAHYEIPFSFFRVNT